MNNSTNITNVYNSPDLIQSKKGGANSQVSIAKGIGIILVVIGHSGAPSFITNFIYSFHMPLFFLLSGYFFKEISSWDQYSHFIIRRIKGLWIPYVLYCIPFLLLHNMLAPLGFDSGTLYEPSDYLSHFMKLLLFKGEPSGYFPAFWFLRALFISSILLASISFIKSSMKIREDRWIEVICVFGLAVFALHFFYNVLLIKLTLVSTIFLCIGVAYRHLMEKGIRYSWGLVVITMIVTAVCSYIFGFVQITEVDSNYFMTYVLLAIIGTLFIMSISYKIDLHNTFFKKILVYVGNHTMVVLALHAIVFKLLNNVFQLVCDAPHEAIYGLNMSQYGRLLWVVYSFLGMAIPVLLCYIKGLLINKNAK